MSLLDLVRSLIVRGSVTGSDPSQQTQSLSVNMMVDEDEDGVENFAEPYGLANALPAGTECIIVSVGGAADHQVVVGTADKANRPKDLEAGETALYSEHGVQVRMTEDGDVALGVANAAEAAAAKALAIAEAVDARLATIQAAFDAHIHVTTATVGVGAVGVLSPTTAPIGSLATTAAEKVRGK